jgi:H+/Cl- antiporter ClcA
MATNVQTRKSARVWLEAAAWGVWVLLLVFLLQNAIASGNELEPRAATLFWTTFVVVLLGGLVVGAVRWMKKTH